MSSKDSVDSQGADEKRLREKHVLTSSFEEVRGAYHLSE